MKQKMFDEAMKERMSLGSKDRHAENVMVGIFGVINLVLLVSAFLFRW